MHRHTLAGGPQTCLEQFAGGWINPQDLCGRCTSLMMMGLSSIAPEPLTWHSAYEERARDRGEGDAS